MHYASIEDLSAQSMIFYSNFHLQNGYTPLHLACRIGHAEIVKELMNRGADVKTASEVCTV